MRMQGRVVMVTGAASGIGRASAEVFAEAGASVVLLDWNDKAGAAAAEEIRGRGLDASFVHADVSSEADAQRAVAWILERYGRLNALMNNAAVQILGALVETREQDWERLHSVNLKGVFLMSKAALPAIIRAGGGAIVNVASILGFVGDPELAAYCAMKGGVIALTKAMAIGYGPQGVRVNCICPGDVNTPMVAEYFDKAPDPEALRREVYSKYALRRIAEPREIAQVALFLASEASSFMTGSVVVVDGGLTSKCY